MAHSVLIKPPPWDPTKTTIEHILELTELSSIEPDLFTNTRPVWQPPGARGIYGGTVIAQCLAAAFRTVPPPSAANDQAVYLPHSMHCYFVLAGSSTIPIIYAVERVREGRSFLTRTVQARQRGKCIFTTTISFVAEAKGLKETLEHGGDLPEGSHEVLETIIADQATTPVETAQLPHSTITVGKPFTSKRLPLANVTSPPHSRKQHLWTKFNGKITGAAEVHICALAFMSDSWFIGTVPEIHRVSSPLSTPPSTSATQTEPLDTTTSQHINPNTPAAQPKGPMGMIVSLDHTIYFHRPREILCNDWLFSEMQSPWAGDSRGLVAQRIWSRQGRLLATCVQEGLVRLAQTTDNQVRSKL